MAIPNLWSKGAAGLRGDPPGGNLALALQAVLASDSPVSRSQIASIVGITRATASRLTDTLVAADILQSLPPEPITGPGRPGVPLQVRPGAIIALALEVNIGHLAAAAVDLNGNVVAEEVHYGDFRNSDPAKTLAELGEMSLQVYRVAATGMTRLAGIRIALPGIVDAQGTHLLRAPNLDWHDIEIAPLLGITGKIPAPVVAGNEADLAAYSVAFTRPGVPSNLPSFVYVSGEVGVGAAIFLDGALFRGANGWAGELGHLCIDPHGPRCNCGATGCLETYLGRSALASACGLDPMADATRICRLADSGSELARSALDNAGRALGQAIADVVNLLDIPVIVLGGGLQPLLEELREPALREISRRTLSHAWTQVTLQGAPAGRMAAIQGAAFRCLLDVVRDPVPSS